MGFLKNLVKTVSKPAKAWVDIGTKIAAPVLNAVAPGTGSLVEGLNNVQGGLYGSVTGTGSQRASLSDAQTLYNAAKADYSGLSSDNVNQFANNALTKIVTPVKSVLSGDFSQVFPATASPAISVKQLANKGILGTKVSTGNDTIDDVISGVVTGGIKAVVTKDQGAKDLLGAASGAAAQSWFEKNWYYIAGGVLAVILFIRGKK